MPFTSTFSTATVSVDLAQREFLAKLVAVSLVGGDVDRLREEGRFIESVDLLLNRVGPASGIVRFARDFGLTLLPCLQHPFLHDARVAGCPR